MSYTLSFDEAVRVLGTTRSTLYKWLQAGKVPGKKLGSQWRFSREELERLRDGVEASPGDAAMAELEAFFQERSETKEEPSMDTTTAPERLADQIVWDAHDHGASDIHLQPQRAGVRLAYRRDGRLDTVTTLPPEVADRVAAVWEARSHPFDRHGDRRLFASRDLPDGLEELQLAYHALDTLQGRRRTLRVVHADAVLDLEKAVPNERARDMLLRYMGAPYGLILLAGPIGSVSYTSFLSCLRHFARTGSRVVFSLEDAIRVRIDGVDQVEVDGADAAAVQGAFARIMHSDLDVLGIGIESEAAAVCALKAARSGHMVLMTMQAQSQREAREKFEALVREPVGDVFLGALVQRRFR